MMRLSLTGGARTKGGKIYSSFLGLAKNKGKNKRGTTQLTALRIAV
jgi:hypothetical protein